MAGAASVFAHSPHLIADSDSLMIQTLLDRVLESPRLPSLPAIALDVIELVQREDVSVREIAQTIQHDPALSSKILKTVNSSFYGQAHAISTISNALVVLGMSSVKVLALGFCLTANLKQAEDDEFDHMSFWKRSLYSATAAKALAREVNLPDQEEAFLGGLLQDLGMLALSQVLGRQYADLLRQVGNDHANLSQLERQSLGMDHAEIGAALATRWGLPPQLIAPIRDHESPEPFSGTGAAITQCVTLGNRVAAVFMSTTPAEALDAYYRDTKRWFALEPEAAEPLLHEIHKQTKEMRRLFDLPTGELGNSTELLARAHEALLQITLQTQQQTTQLEQQNKSLTLQATTDSLTGVANRRQFNIFVTEAFNAATATQRPLSLLFLDTDHFKKINDTYGHPTGDRVLVELAAVLVNYLPQSGLVARYGGEEFTLVLPNTDRPSAAKLAEQIRAAIAETVVMSDDNEPLSVTASIGVATSDRAVFERVEQLIRAADQGVYAAKNSGRNCVRVFVPKTAPAAA